MSFLVFAAALRSASARSPSAIWRFSSASEGVVDRRAFGVFRRGFAGLDVGIVVPINIGCVNLRVNRMR
jgi:hypothetical protein